MFTKNSCETTHCGGAEFDRSVKRACQTRKFENDRGMIDASFSGCTRSDCGSCCRERLHEVLSLDRIGIFDYR
ncbi:unnamed protein product [Litomosoides sigmodontis]|uniref:Uncharacterized protein n=1 Tax=Litomosoides sigmodontis TaxID=42156 RepID=A0A3P6TTZ3_LITSI|nr:unnamed protein product [Litomosoides sigmodontis]